MYFRNYVQKKANGCITLTKNAEEPVNYTISCQRWDPETGAVASPQVMQVHMMMLDSEITRTNDEITRLQETLTDMNALKADLVALG